MCKDCAAETMQSATCQPLLVVRRLASMYLGRCAHDCQCRSACLLFVAVQTEDHVCMLPCCVGDCAP
jgi:hypothetical protein